ncbi:MAG: ROK family protein [Thermoplasmata archaeon]|nr:ROK family protein [Thermoplasmata archaeon]
MASPAGVPRRGAFGSDRPLTIGIDIGATKVRAALVDAAGQVVHGSAPRLLARRTPPHVVDVVADVVATELGATDRPVPAIGVAVAAQVDAKRGRVLYAPNLEWANVPIGRALARRTGRIVVLENDVRAAVYGEWSVGAARGVGQVVMIWCGTGLGGGLVVDGRLLRGARGAAGELGHLTIVSGGRRCHCPNRGCLEAYVGGWGIGERARDAVRTNSAAGRRLTARAGRRADITAETVFAAAAEGDPLSRRLVQETETYLAAGAVTIVNATNPSLVLLGGTILDAWRGLPGRLERELRRRCQPPAAGSVRVRRTGLGAWSPIVGAALRAAETSGTRASPAT